ncbi:hypothetical protein B0J11DRAFT_536520 [Dendryphion nanum]|uniref:Secreted protein n=1 Tax=Dendryphion nanum TaxID=256645 RepID=A0A9P9DEG0_9PLEO|nr:hypothetical protein B0J11DRAFT_536520 [Dendryphion nanum]
MVQVMLIMLIMLMMLMMCEMMSRAERRPKGAGRAASGASFVGSGRKGRKRAQWGTNGARMWQNWAGGGPAKKRDGGPTNGAHGACLVGEEGALEGEGPFLVTCKF